MDEVRVGVIGYGNMGTGHANWLANGQVPGAVLGAVADTNPERREIAAKHGAPLFESPDALFASKSVDAVIIATPHYLHPPLAIQALQSGLHVMVEKPAGVYTRQVREMNEFAAKSDKVFGIMFNQRTNGAHQKMRQLVSSGELGELRRVTYTITDWFRTQSYYDSGGWRATWAGEGGGVLLNQCPHNLDLWQWICGMPARIRAFAGFGRHHKIEVEDDVTAYFEYANGATGTFIACTGESPGTNSFEIAGDRGRLVLKDGKLTFHRTTVSVKEYLDTEPGGFNQPERWACDIPFQPGEEHVGILKNWVAAISTGSPLLANGAEGINGVTLANAMLLSAWTDKWVDIPFDENLYYDELQKRIAESKVDKSGVNAKTFDLTGTY